MRKPITIRDALRATLAAALFVLALPAAAQDFTVQNGQTVTTTQTMNNPGDTGTVEEGGTISTAGGANPGVEMQNADQTLTNDGTIRTTGASSEGVRHTAASGLVVNNGTIRTFGGISHGILSDGAANSTYINNGVIRTSGGSADGMAIDSANAHVVNNGSIVATGANASGIDIGNDGDGTHVDNSGLVMAATQPAIRVKAGANNVVVNNSGHVEATGAGDEAIAMTGGNGTVINSGTVISNGGYAIRFFQSGATLTLLAGTNIQGGIRFMGGNNTLNLGPGFSSTMTFNQAPNTVNSAQPFVVLGTTVAHADLTAVAHTDEALTDLTRTLAGAVESRLTATRACTTPDGYGDVVACQHDSALWATGFGVVRDETATATVSGFEHKLGGGALGLDLAAWDLSRIGLFGGGHFGGLDADGGNFAVETLGGFGGGYLSLKGEALFFDLQVAGGLLSHDQKRLVANNAVPGGVETARADFTGLYVAPSARLGVDAHLDGFKLTPSVRVRHARLWLDGYTETGSAGALTVQDRTVDVLEGRGEIAATIKSGDAETGIWTAALRLGVDAVTNWGEDVNAVLLGQAISFAPGEDETVIRPFLGVDAVLITAGGTRLSAGAEVGREVDDESLTVAGTIAASVPF